MSGMILSPHHPGYYPALTRCRWTINVPRGNTIKLRFLEFQLEDHPSCFNDFLEIYSGLKSKTFMGKYCGERFPPFIESFSNVMEITFVSNDKINGLGFKLHYAADVDKEACLQYEGCPSNCECNPISRKSREMVITVKKGRKLTALPGNIPSKAAVM
ncbi:unnamed protein product [Porites evermanni]|uniref:CUB domain-containing protein n=1 Tax=Porites evermanni TaxID=104178 RepID=A0ABN8T4G2_9CNID|nr:unnamed protein product [Porites evermanni]